ncbi:MAG: methionine synthase, partial [Gammaproteobacteria bacterium]|nr:methionine synthase [Gammaproteobacteria bacterium]
APQVTLEQARDNRFVADWDDYTPPQPRLQGIEVFNDYPLDELARYIDWSPFFNAWELSGRYPKILEDSVVGETARRLYDDAQAMLAQVIEQKWVNPRGVIGMFPANSVGHDDIAVYTDATRETRAATLHHLRQQKRKPRGHNHNCLADYVAPLASGREDYIGGFAVCAGEGLDEHVARFETANDDYNAILLKALADRLAEAFAERMHERVRREFWGYDSDETLDNEQLIAERYRGIRPAPGYPACPDHTEKQTLWRLLDVERRAGMRLTESFAMYPTAAVSGWYFSHPDSKYFLVGQVARDQIEDYAQRKGMPVAAVERWLGHILGYESDIRAA